MISTSSATIMPLVIFSTPFCRPSEQTEKQTRITRNVVQICSTGLLTVAPNTPPSASAPVTPMIEPVRYFQK